MTLEEMREACAKVAQETQERWQAYSRQRDGVTIGAEHYDPHECDLVARCCGGITAAIRALPTPDAPVDALMGEVDNRFGLTEGEWFYPEGEHSSDECRFSPDEVIDYALEGDATTQVVAIERAMSLPTVYAAVRVWSDAEKDDRQSDDDYDYTLHASADDARAALAQVQSINPTTLSGEGGEG